MIAGYFSTMIRSSANKDMWVVYSRFEQTRVSFKEIEAVLNEEAAILFYKVRYE